jgi:hypothetical protein
MSSGAAGSLAETYPQLRRLFGAYFHEDWPAFHETPDDVIRQYRADASASLLAETADQLRGLLGRGLSEAELERALRYEFLSSRVPSLGGESNRTWLEEVLRLLDAPA